MKKLIAILLTAIMVFALASAAFAADEKETAVADALNALGLFQGVGKDAEGKPIYDLDRTPNRMEAVTMLVRLLGKEKEAIAGTWEIPFTDVMDWAKPYVGYAYANGLTNGTGKTTFSGKDPVTATQYLTFVLRAMGYSEADGDFRWDAAWELSDKLNITHGEYDASTASFDRGDVVKISWSALAAYVKGEGRFLGEKLLDEGVFTLEQYHAAMSGERPEEEGQNPVMNFIGDYQSGRASAHVECEGMDSARITIRWGGSAWEEAVWVIVGKLDLDTLTVAYTGAVKTNVTYGDDGELKSEEKVYEDGTGSIAFHDDGTFTWHEDQSENGSDLVFEWIPVEPEEEGQNPVMNFVGNYQSGRASAHVECEGTDSARITIRWGGSAWEEAVWVIVGKLDLDTLTVAYTGAVKTNVTYGDDGELKSEEKVYEDGTGSIVFHDDGTFTWHEDQSECGSDLVFEWVPVTPSEEEGKNPAAEFAGTYSGGRPNATVACEGTDSARIEISWSSSYAEHSEWVIVGKLDPETLTIQYSGGVMKTITYLDEENFNEVVNYTNGSGTVKFSEDGTMIWTENNSANGPVTFQRVQTGGINYLALVNKLNPLPEGWEDELEIVTVTNSVGDEVEVEAKAYAAYALLKADLEENDGIYLELDSARRSVAAQQDIMDRFVEKYGADYAAKTVAQPGYSEHHTGLALDLYFKIRNSDGSFTDVYYNEDMEKEEYKGIWSAIHAKLPEYGFILRYLEGEEHITGYRYEPWHIRYVDSADIAKGIMSQPGYTLEEYLAGKSAPEAVIDLSGSSLYTEAELKDAMLAIKCKFAAWRGCELHSIRYAGDEANSAENLAWLNSLAEGAEYTQVAEFLMDFHTAPDIQDAWEPDHAYADYQWWLARSADGGWEIVSWGY